ncbi:M16 family metallopeptidase [Virgibacillus kimchii]
MEIITLDNGIRVVVDPVSHFKTFSVGFFIKIGSKYENKDEHGITHLIEHMLLKSNLYQSKSSIQSYFDSIGAELNAFTTKEYVCIFARSLKQFSEEIIQQLYNMVMFPLFDNDEIENEKKVIYKEISQHNNNYSNLATNNIVKCSFNKHPLSQNIIGTKYSVSSLNRQDLMNYYKKRLNHENLVISMSGNINTDIIEGLQKLDFINNSCFTERQLEDVTFHSGKQIEKKEGLSHAYINIAYPGVPLNSDKLTSLNLVSSVIGHGYSSLLYNKFRDEKNLVYSIYSRPLIYKEGGLLIIHTSTVNSFSNDLPRMINQEIKKKVWEGISSDELNKSIAILKTKISIGLEDSKMRMLELGKKVILDINNSLSINDYEKLLNQISIDDLNKFLTVFLLEEPSVSIVKGIT